MRSSCSFQPIWWFQSLTTLLFPLHLQTKNFSGDGIEIQAEQALKNMGEVLKAAGSSYGKVVKTTVLLAHMGDFQAVNGVYSECHPRSLPTILCFVSDILFLSFSACLCPWVRPGKFFTEDPLPARAAFAVKELPLGAKIEIECVAVSDD